MDLSNLKYLHRYTRLEELENLLENHTIRFSNWRNWADKNDTALLEYYQERKNKAVFVYCLTSGSETIHHWNAYAKVKGCRIKYNLEKMLEFAERQKVIAEPISYIKHPDLKRKPIDDDKLPFIKRHPYRVEEEFRLVKPLKKEAEFFDFKINPAVIDEISLSPFYMPATNERIKRNLLTKYPYLEGKFSNSKIMKYDQWINHFNSNKSKYD